MGQYSIKDLEVLTGIKAHTLRIWEQRYNLLQPERTETNIRLYDDEQLKKILNVSLLNNNGVKISKIAQLSEIEIAKKIQNFNKKDNDYTVYINSLISGMVSLERQLIDETLAKHVEFDSMSFFFTKVIFPFFNKIGLLWASNGVNPAQEHFVSNIIKRFLLTEIEKVEDPKSTAPKFILMLPEGEWHELSLLLAEFILKKNGNNVLYLGASVPNDDLTKILDLYNAKYILCVGLLAKDLKESQNTINQLSCIDKKTKFLFAGKAFYAEKLHYPINCEVVSSFDELVLFN